MRDRMLFRSMGLAIMLLMVGGMVQAADVYLNLTQPSGNNPNWNATGYWSPDTPPSPGNVYWVGTTGDGVTVPPGYTGGRMQVRSPNNASATFSGDRLNITSNPSPAAQATFMMKASNGQTVTLPTGGLHCYGDDPQIECGNNGVLHLVGTVFAETNQPGGYINIAVTDTGGQRHVALDGTLSGNGGVRVAGTNSAGTYDHALELNNDNSAFTGRFFTRSGYDGQIIVNNVKGLGNATTITIQNKGKLSTTVGPINQPNTNMVVQTGSAWTIDQTYAFKSLRLPGNIQVGPGTYTAATLAPMSNGTITDGGGQVIVNTGLPELSVPHETDGTITTCTFGPGNPWLPAPTATITITNVGFTPLSFVSMANQASPANPGIVLEQTSTTVYQIVSVVPSSATPLGVGASMTITVKLNATLADYDPTPGAINDKLGTLRIYTNSFYSPTGMGGAFNIPLRGTTVPVEVSKFTTE